MDWFITTPTMILSTITFMDYIRRKEAQPVDRKTQEVTNLWTFLRDNWKSTTLILVSNVIMLLMGFLHEMGIVDIWTSTMVGFVAFGSVFYEMRTSFANSHAINEYLWTYMVSTWGMYGVAALFPNIIKNTAYNLLDIVSKNFYSVFLTTYILNLT